jgi:hypothetical protein
MTAPSELQIQAGFRARLRYIAPSVSCVAIPNAAKRTQWAAMRAKQEGLVAGAPDVICIWPGGGICWIEFKAARGKLTPNQVDFHDKLERFGHRVAVARSIDEAVAFLKACGAPVLEARDAA